MTIGPSSPTVCYGALDPPVGGNFLDLLDLAEDWQQHGRQVFSRCAAVPTLPQSFLTTTQRA
jgi:hypothetical protein